MHIATRPATTDQERFRAELAPAQNALGLEARLAAADAEMTVRLETAALAVDVNTAHILTTPIDLADIVRIPDAIATAPVDLYPTPVASLLQRAHQRLTNHGWCAGAMVNTNGARCLYGSIHAEASGNQHLETKALEILLDAIHRRFPDAESVPTWNDAWGGPRTPLRLLELAADDAHTRGL
ncbi:hypothetical protein [Streptomyces sp. ME19-01-6]|uniref:DUF6197 family protein n=1 Tax=Streptomyces sp. ME19-01-6 TaxID=3028686 RepID=UPI0029A0E73B|nr:hypothetical protein [Streptomyces sp. ME19-01-6]MDX3232518.1 hypothetical protein [Streptomyces sp. ME19-01-6]